MSVQAYQMYKKTQVSIASQGELIIMLFDGAIKFANQAKELILQRDFAGANNRIIRTQDIVNELIYSLDFDTGEIAHNLFQLYTYINDLLIQANIKKDNDRLDEALNFLEQLRDTWRQVVAVS